MDSTGIGRCSRDTTAKVTIGKPIYEGKAKIVYETSDPSRVIIRFKDSATAFDGKKKGEINNKGEMCAAISTKLFGVLEDAGIHTHFLGLVGARDMLARKMSMIPVEVVVRNIAAGSLAKRLGLEEGVTLKTPVVEFYYKSDALGDPMINQYHAAALGLATNSEMGVLADLGLKINEILGSVLSKAGLLLVDFKLEFGRADGQILLGDEISPDTCRFWDAETTKKLDKDRFRRDLGGVEEAYREVLSRLESVLG